MKEYSGAQTIVPSGGVDRRRIWGPLLIMTVVTLFSSSPGIQAGRWSFIGIDKVGHFVVFGLLGIAWVRCLPPVGRGLVGRLWLPVLLAALFGVFDEVHQLQNPDRTFEWADLAADMLGALILGVTYLRVPYVQVFLELEFRVRRHLPSFGKPSNSRE